MLDGYQLTTARDSIVFATSSATALASRTTSINPERSCIGKARKSLCVREYSRIQSAATLWGHDPKSATQVLPYG
ncbi:hypothetical protein PM082_008088 [Marasmius tenuissimus]|nr:hypothetical protein PM082_008088 [Marasmius tenuissimus]